MPDYTREGGSIPVTLDFANILNLNVLLLPVGRGDDGAHSTNEKIDTDNYIRVRIFFLYQTLKMSGFCLTCGFVFTGHQTSWNLYVRACRGSGLSRDAKVKGGCIF